MGSLVFLGIVVNGMLAGWLFKLYPTKPVMIAALFFSQLSLLLFISTENYYLSLLARFFMGAFQVFHIVFLPVWIDKYGG